MPRTTLSGTSENDLVGFIRKNFTSPSPLIKRGIGDDGAVLRLDGAREYWVLSTDVLLERIDFRQAWITAEQLGHKALAVNLSDLAAMGARPRFYTVSLGLPRKSALAWIDGFYRGMTKLAKRHRALLVGGDLSRSVRDIYISVTVLGDTDHRSVVSRSGGRPGDILFVTGTLGKSASGFRLLQKGVLKSPLRAQRDALKTHRLPMPRCEVGLWLARTRMARAMIDLSDGLSIDLPRLCTESGTGAEIYASSLPLFQPASDWGCDPLELALHGGEDYELLFAVPPHKVPELGKRYPRGYPAISAIGRLTRTSMVVLRPKPGGGIPRPLPKRGFDHFAVT